MNDVEKTAVSGLGNQEWFVKLYGASRKVQVTFDNGKSNYYAGDGTTKIGDIFIVGPGYKSSYAMGTVTALETRAGVSKLAPAAMGFQCAPTAKDIRTCQNKILALEKMSDLRELHDYNYWDFFETKDLVITDIMISNILCALSILSFPKRATQEMLSEARAYLQKKVEIPHFMYRKKMGEAFGEECAVLAFSGYYPGWREEVKDCSIWDNSVITRDGDELCEDEPGVLEYDFEGSEEMENAFVNDKAFNDMFEKLVYKSVMAILIRGNMLNLLQTALRENLPVTGYMNEIVQIAKEFGRTECYDLLTGKEMKIAPAKTADEKPVEI